MVSPEGDLQARIIRIGLPHLEPFGFAVAGGHALRLHGVLDRPSEDVDFFTNRTRETVTAARDALLDALTEAGMDASIDPISTEQFLRLWVTDGHTSTKVELGIDWRSQDPDRVAEGLVISKEDSAASKLLALWGRAAAKDALDVDAYLQDGQFTAEQLLEAAIEHDDGFTADMLPRSLRITASLSDADYAVYGASPERAAEVRAAMLAWAEDLERAAATHERSAGVPLTQVYPDPTAPNFGQATGATIVEQGPLPEP